MAFSGINTPTSLLQVCKEGNVCPVQEHIPSLSCDLLACGEDSNIALHLAAEQGHMAVIQELAGRYPTSSACKNTKGRTPLHMVSARGHCTVVEALAQRFPGDLEARDENGDTPLHLAALFGHMETVDLLCQQFHCDPSVKGHDDCTVLHYACAGGHLDIVRRLLLRHELDPLDQDVRGDTPLHYAACDGHADVLDTLISEFNCSPHVRSTNTLLHQAAGGGHCQLVQKLIVEYGLDPAHEDDTGRTAIHWAIGSDDTLDCVRKTIYKSGGHYMNVVEKLVSEYACDVNARDNDGLTPLHVAALAGREEVVRELITKYKCPVDCVDYNGNTPLHWASREGHAGVVRMLLSEFGTDAATCIKNGSSALNLAALNGHAEVVGVLVSEFGCSPSVKGQYGRTLIHRACSDGHLAVVEKLASEYGCDVNAGDNDGLTPLHVVAACGREEVVRALITKYKCPVDCVDYNGNTPLHWAAMKGRAGVVRMLLSEFGADVASRNKHGDTVLTLAAFNGHTEIVGVLVSEFGCSPCVTGQYGLTPLHDACNGGHLVMVEKLVSEYGCDVNARDNGGHTLLYFAIHNRHLSIVAELVRHNSDLTFVDATHKKLIKSANKISKNVRARVFVVGTPEVGKSTLIEAIRSETFFLRNVKQIPPHTAGIVPVFHESSDYGWVVFYDFAGDEEYYSSHAAILKTIMGNSSDIFLLVFDLSKLSVDGMGTAHSIYYWLSFLSYVSSSQLQVVLIGSHADVLQKEGKDADQVLSEIFTDVSQSFYSEFPDTSVEMFGCVALNCCLTKSPGLQKIKAQLKQIQISSLSNVPRLTAGASILLGTLERDFQGKVACQVKGLINHIESCEIYLPQEAEQLHSYLTELHGYGLVLLLKCSSPWEDEWVVLDLPLFLSTVHKKLFSSFYQCEDPLSNLGIIPNARLQTMFPEFSLALLKGCLTLLQYCQEIDDPQIISKIFEIPEVETGLNQSFLFFPALLQSSRKKVKWIRSYGSPLCCIGWCMECYRTYDFFPPRFLHVLLLRLAFTFALPKTPSELDDGAAIVDVYSRKCTLWKNGIHWLMESGVEVVVEVVKQKRAVLVMVRGSRDQEVECGDILSMVVVKVAEAKSQFCNVLKANLYIVIPNDPRQSTPPEAEQLQLFEAKYVEEVLLKGSEGAVSRDGKGFLPSSDLICLQSQTAWNLLFPMGIKSLMHQLEDIVRKWYQLGMELGLPPSKLEEIEVNNPGNVLRCKRLMLQEWERRPTLKPSWSSLVDALREMNENTIADRMSQQCHVDLQRRLLDPTLACCELDDDTLQQLAHSTGDVSVFIASLHSFTATEIEQMRSEDQPAVAMFRKLKEKGTVTHEQLCHYLQMIPLLNPTI